MTEARNDLWHVQMASGEVLVMTLDELDEAFQDDRIGESTMVLQGGALKWAPLGEVLGGDDTEAPATEPAPPPIHVPSITSSAPLSSCPASYPAVPTPAESAVPSVRPMAFDVGSTAALEDDDFDADLALRPNKKKVVLLGLAAAAVIACVGFGASKLVGATGLDATATNASIASLAAAAAAPVAPPETRAVNDTPAADSLPGSRLSDSQKAMLAKMDGKLAAEERAKDEAAAARAAKQHRGKHKRGKSGFHDGGDPMDPLNGHLK